MVKRALRVTAGLGGGVVGLGVHRMFTAGLVDKLPLQNWPRLRAFVSDAAAVGQAVIGYGLGHAAGAWVSNRIGG